MVTIEKSKEVIFEERRKEIMEGLKKAVVEFDQDKVVKLSNKVLENGIEPLDAILNGLAAGMEIVGDLFAKQEYFVPEVLMCADALYAGLNILRPHVKSEELKSKVKGTVVIGTVEGDIHDIGKNLVKMFFEIAGFTVVDLGRDVPLDKFVDETLKTGAELVCMSALMTTTMVGMKKVVEKLRAKKPEVKIMVGGAPLSKEVASEFGADGYAPDASNAVQEAIKMIASLKKVVLKEE